jgi:hypothetical protein
MDNGPDGHQLKVPGVHPKDSAATLTVGHRQ